MNVKVAAFTVSKKSINTISFTCGHNICNEHFILDYNIFINILLILKQIQYFRKKLNFVIFRILHLIVQYSLCLLNIVI